MWYTSVVASTFHECFHYCCQVNSVFSGRTLWDDVGIASVSEAIEQKPEKSRKAIPFDEIERDSLLTLTCELIRNVARTGLSRTWCRFWISSCKICGPFQVPKFPECFALTRGLAEIRSLHSSGFVWNLADHFRNFQSLSNFLSQITSPDNTGHLLAVIKLRLNDPWSSYGTVVHTHHAQAASSNRTPAELWVDSRKWFYT